MPSLWLWVVLLCLMAAQVRAVHYDDAGRCGLAVAAVDDHIAIVYPGVDLRALQRLNALLDTTVLEPQDTLREAETWSRTYRALGQRLAERGRDDAFARDVHTLVQEGQFEDAGSLLDHLFAFEETTAERAADYHCSRADLFTLLFRPLEALPHYAQAYRSHPITLRYAQRYALALYQQHRSTEAELLYQATLTMARALASTDPVVYLPEVAITLPVWRTSIIRRIAW